jgi:hypothetical protein
MLLNDAEVHPVPDIVRPAPCALHDHVLSDSAEEAPLAVQGLG